MPRKQRQGKKHVRGTRELKDTLLMRLFELALKNHSCANSARPWPWLSTRLPSEPIPASTELKFYQRLVTSNALVHNPVVQYYRNQDRESGP